MDNLPETTLISLSFDLQEAVETLITENYQFQKAMEPSGSDQRSKLSSLFDLSRELLNAVNDNSVRYSYSRSVGVITEELDVVIKKIDVATSSEILFRIQEIIDKLVEIVGLKSERSSRLVQFHTTEIKYEDLSLSTLAMHLLSEARNYQESRLWSENKPVIENYNQQSQYMIEFNVHIHMLWKAIGFDGDEYSFPGALKTIFSLKELLGEMIINDTSEEILEIQKLVRAISNLIN